MKQTWFKEGGMEILLLVLFATAELAWCALLGEKTLGLLKTLLGGP